MNINTKLLFQNIFCIATLLIGFVPKSFSQDKYTEQIKKYIEKYYPLAVQEQRRMGIPASITLAQGIHETDAGASELMTKANNHFGIKCKGDWKGETFLHTDNAPDECFKKYKTAGESYRDHSELLKKNPRYSRLFTLSKTDYAAWAVGLKTCGYATNPQYSVVLIKLIEDYRLQEYTYLALQNGEEKNLPIYDLAKLPSQTSNTLFSNKTDSLNKVIDSLQNLLATKQTGKPNNKNEKTKKDIANTKKSSDSLKTASGKQNTNLKSRSFDAENLKNESDSILQSTKSDNVFDSGKLIMINGLKAFYAYKGEMLLKYAVTYKIRYARLLELNDLPDAPLEADMPIYIEKKHISGTHSKHTVKENENMLLISQEEGMILKRLYTLNMLKPKEEPAVGTVLELQIQTSAKPILVAIKKKVVPKIDDKVTKKLPQNEYINVPHPKPAIDSAIDDSVDDDDTVVVAPKVTKKPFLLMEDSTSEDISGLKTDIDKVVHGKDNNSKVTPKTVEAKKQDKLLSSKKSGTEKNINDKKSKTYKIKKGDTLSTIADKFDVSIKQLRQWNNISGSSIRDGQIIRVE